MTQDPSQPYSTPRPRTTAGAWRRVGVELEFSGMKLREAAQLLGDWAGAAATVGSSASAVVEHPELGHFELELDSSYVKQLADEDRLDNEQDTWAQLVHHAARRVVPLEIICPPIPLAELHRLDSLLLALRRAGATGTEESWYNAFGLQLNVEIPALDAAHLTGYIQAFALLQWWLAHEHQVDATRKTLQWAKLWPESYLLHVAAYDAPEMSQLLDDYHTHNPSRNRALDLWPIFAEYDEARVRTLMDDPLIKARPAFHYRLPNCEIDHADWNLAVEWQRWVKVEALAADTIALRALCLQFLNADKPVIGVSRNDWKSTMAQWIRDRS